MNSVITGSPSFIGYSLITDSFGLSAARARAARISIIMLIQRS